LEQRKTHRQIASGGGFGELAYQCFTSSDPVLQKTRNSCRHTCACRCNSLDLLDEDIHKNDDADSDSNQSKLTARAIFKEIQNSDTTNQNFG
jgi:hypothetical protein